MKHPKALYLLTFVQMWRCFSHYGMRALLVLYMLKELQFSDSYAFGVYAVYCALIELGGLFGGMFADRVLGARKTVMLGGWLIGLGHLAMASEKCLFVALGLIVVGMSLFTTNITALVGMCYKQGDRKKEEGFTLFYMGMNFGALVATVACAYAAEQFGWHTGFSLAALGMLAGNIALMVGRRHLDGKGEAPAGRMRQKSLISIPLFAIALFLASSMIAQEGIIAPALPWLTLLCLGGACLKLLRSKNMTKGDMKQLLVALGAMALFYAACEQIASSLVVFAERTASKSLLGMPISSTMIITVNPLVIILLGVPAAILCRRLGARLRLVLPFILGSVAYGGLSMLCAFSNAKSVQSLAPILGVVALLSFAELLIGPAVYSRCSEIGGEKEAGTVMGLVPIGFALAASLGGGYSKLMAIDEGHVGSFYPVYGLGFGVIAAVLALAALGFIWVPKSRQQPVDG